MTRFKTMHLANCTKELIIEMLTDLERKEGLKLFFLKLGKMSLEKRDTELIISI